MISKEEVQSKLRKASIIGRAQAPEVHYHLIEAHICLEKELYIASCLCSITFIDISMRYLDAVLKNTEISNDGTRHIKDRSIKPELHHKVYIDRDMMLRLMNRGVDISPLAIEGVAELNKVLSSDRGKPMIRQLRDDLCHGNISNYFEARPDGDVFHPVLMKQQAHELYVAANSWLNEFQRCCRALGY
ncbi:hypothetical protein ACE3G8_03790 [Vreelandella venusta]